MQGHTRINTRQYGHNQQAYLRKAYDNLHKNFLLCPSIIYQLMCLARLASNYSGIITTDLSYLLDITYMLWHYIAYISLQVVLNTNPRKINNSCKINLLNACRSVMIYIKSTSHVPHVASCKIIVLKCLCDKTIQDRTEICLNLPAQAYIFYIYKILTP